MTNKPDALSDGQSTRPSDSVTRAWECTDVNYPYICGIVTTREETVEAWREGGIEFTPLVRPVPAPVGLEREEIAELAERMRAARHMDCFDEAFLPLMTPKERDAIIAALSPDHRTEPAVNPSNPDRGEPVAWQRIYKSGGTMFTVNKAIADEWAANGSEVRPLYSHPPVSAEREALEKALEAFADLQRRLMSYCNHANAGHMPSDAREFARRIILGFAAAYEQAGIAAPKIEPETAEEYRSALSSTDGRSSAGQSDIAARAARICEEYAAEFPRFTAQRDAAIACGIRIQQELACQLPVECVAWNWLPIDHRPLPTGKYLVGHRGHQEIWWFVGPEKEWAPGTNLGWHRIGGNWRLPAGDPATLFKATHCILIEAPGDAP